MKRGMLKYMINLNLKKITDPIIFAGNDKVAYRDPAAIYADGWFH